MHQPGRGGGGAVFQRGRATGLLIPHCIALTGYAVGHGSSSGGLGFGLLSRPVSGLELGSARRGTRAVCRMSSENDDKTGNDEVPSFLSGVLPSARQPLRGNSRVGEEEVEEVEEVGEPWPHGDCGEVEPREVFPKDPPAMDARPAETEGPHSPSPMWDTWREEEVMASPLHHPLTRAQPALGRSARAFAVLACGCRIV